MFLFPITANEILLIIHELKNKKSVGYDNVSTSLVKYCAIILSDILEKLFNSCVEQGYYPDELKKARVIPIYKKGDPLNVDNYRPISLLSLINQIFEKLLYKRVLSHLNRMKFFSWKMYTRT